MKYTISKKRLDEQGRNEWDTLKTTERKSEAIRYAKTQSKKCLETEVLGLNEEDGEVEFHAFYRKGRLEINMSV